MQVFQTLGQAADERQQQFPDQRLDEEEQRRPDEQGDGKEDRKQSRDLRGRRHTRSGSGGRYGLAAAAVSVALAGSNRMQTAASWARG